MSTSVLVLLGSISSSVITVTMVSCSRHDVWLFVVRVSSVRNRDVFAMLLSFLITIAALSSLPFADRVEEVSRSAVVTVLATLGFLIVFFIIGAIIRDARDD